ncbi:MAG: late competence development ComFB family protein [Oscillospiraceae bacterium]|nr:late competence development ComFB family protein [Oscillospiraceae bacterium]
MALINMTEIIARQKLTELLQESDCCKCEQCYLDMLAFALNNLKPMYVNSKQGQLISRINSTIRQRNVDMDIAIVKAISIVSSSPHRASDEDDAEVEEEDIAKAE